MIKAKHIFQISVSILAIGYFIYKVVSNSFTGVLISKSPQRVKAVIINGKNYMGNSPVSGDFSYSYQFFVNGKSFIGNAHNNGLTVGDTIEVEYHKDNPDINQPIHRKN